jgi:hypothetical protein
MNTVAEGLIFAQNTLPIVTKVSSAVRSSIPRRATTGLRPPSLFWKIPPILPDDINLDSASGGYSSVIEFSSNLCLREFDAQFSDHILTVDVSPDDLVAATDAKGGPFASPFLNFLQQQGVGSLPYSLSLHPSPESLEFLTSLFFNTPRIHVTYDVAIHLAPQGSPLGDTETEGALRGNIGAFRLDIELPFQGTPVPSIAGATVTADIQDAEVSVDFGNGDVNRLRRDLPSFNAIDITTYVKKRTVTGKTDGQFRLVPEVSLVGAGSAADLPVTEFAEKFSVSVFAVGDPPWQALAVAFDVHQDCSGQIAAVEYFVGDSDYGIISDENVIFAILQYRRRSGDFPREIYYEARAPFTENGHTVEGTISGSIVLDTLDDASVLFDANARTEVLVLSGKGTVEVSWVKLDDGAAIKPFGDLQFIEQEPAPWTMITRLTLSDELSDVPSIRAFQQAAHLGGYHFLTTPFTQISLTAPDLRQVDYVRLDGITGQLVALGEIPNRAL